MKIVTFCLEEDHAVRWAGEGKAHCSRRWQRSCWSCTQAVRQYRVISPIKHPDRRACVRRGSGDKAAWGGVTHKISRWASLSGEAMVLKQRRVASPINHPDKQTCVRRGNGIKAVLGGIAHKMSRQASLCQDGQLCHPL